jgi:ribosomal protein L29
MTKELKDKKIEELLKSLYEKKESLRVLKSNVGSTKVKNVKGQSTLKKDIARIFTEMNSRKTA